MTGNETHDSLSDEDVQKVSRISLEESGTSETPWCTKCKNSILKLEDTMPGISSIVPTFNLNMAVGRVWWTDLDYSSMKENISATLLFPNPKPIHYLTLLGLQLHIYQDIFH